MSLANTIRNIFRAAHFLDKRCLHCIAPFTPGFQEDLLCPQCKLLVEKYSGPKCCKCGIPPGSVRFSQTGSGFICARCLKENPAWDKIFYYGIYDGVLKDLLLRFKFDGDLKLAELFGNFLVQISSAMPAPDLMLAMPQFPERLRKRGFNQAHELAKSFAKKSGINIDAKMLRRIRSGQPQEKLTAAQRKANLAGAFKASSAIAGKSVWLIDDIMTTGATCNEAANALKNAGATSVDVFIMARTPI